MKKIIIIPLLLFSCFARAQSVGIGTTSPNSSAILDLGPSAKPFVLPRLSLPQMNGVTNPVPGMLIYNTDESQLYSYMRYQTITVNDPGNNKWQPVSTGPRMIAWGVVDSFAVIKNGSPGFSVTYDLATHWYRLTLSNPLEYLEDSMLLMVTPVGSGAWDQAVSTKELIESTDHIATIKFSDVSRILAGSNALDTRRRSGFHFTLYDLRKVPY
ncbi:MAG: hypothetical protein H7Z13_18865 [Ferruginibacter sp.]|nr:hypothetical protein [Ferruginibacter sp.]